MTDDKQALVGAMARLYDDEKHAAVAEMVKYLGDVCAAAKKGDEEARAMVVGAYLQMLAEKAK